MTNGLGNMDIVDDLAKSSFFGWMGLEVPREKVVLIANTYSAYPLCSECRTFGISLFYTKQACTIILILQKWQYHYCPYFTGGNRYREANYSPRSGSGQ